MATIGDIVAKLKVDDKAWGKGLKSAGSKMQRFRKGVGVAAAGVTAAVSAMTVAGVAATRVYSDFADKMAKVRAITGASAGDMKKLTDEAKKLGSETAFKASEVAEAMTFLGMAGMNTEQTLASIRSVLDVAAAGGIELAEAADIVTDVGTAMGYAADEIGTVGDILAKTASSANTSISMMGETMKFAAPLASATGQSLEEVSAAAGVLANAGIKGTMAGTDLKNIMTVLAKETEIMGVKTTDATGKIRPMLETMAELQQATKGMTDSERVTAFVDTFGKISAKSALNLASMAEAGIELKGSLEGASGTASEMATVMQDNVGGSIRKLQSAYEGLMITIGEGLSPVIRTVADMLTEMTTGTNEDIQKTGDFFWYVARAVGGVGDAIQGFQIIFKGVQSVVTGFIANWISQFELFANTIQAVANKIPGVEIHIGDMFTTIREDLDRLASEQGKEFEKMLDAELPSTRIMREFEAAQKKAQQAAENTVGETVESTASATQESLVDKIKSGVGNAVSSTWDFIKSGAEQTSQFLSQMEIGKSNEDTPGTATGPRSLRRNSEEFFRTVNSQNFNRDLKDEQKKTNEELATANATLSDLLTHFREQPQDAIGLLNLFG